MDRGNKRTPLPAAVLLLGAVSLLTDASSEMIFPLLPAFLAARFPSAPVLLGTMEGLADLVAALSKWYAGRRADSSLRLKPMVLAGYSLATLARPMMAFVTLWWQPLVIRAVDRVGKGIRGTPRDAMIASWVPMGSRGRAFGFHRGMDHAGAALGSLVGAGLVALGIAVDRIFLIAAIPGALSVALIAWVKEPAREMAPSKDGARAPIPTAVFTYLIPVSLFGLANATDAFLLLKLTEEGASMAMLPLAWLGLHLIKSAVSYPAGRVADALGTPKVVLTGWVLYALSYLGLAMSKRLVFTLCVMAFYGLYHALAEGAERALLADITPAGARGRAFGAYYASSGVAAVVGGVLFGVLWQRFSSTAAFLSAAIISAASALLFYFMLPRIQARAS